VVLALSCVATALAIGRLSAGASLESDSAIGVALVVAMAIGIAGMDLYSYLRPDAWQPDIHGLLFGDIFTATPAATVWAVVVALLVIGLVTLGYRQLMFYTFDEEGALIFGAPVRVVHYVFLAVMALTIVSAMRLVGVVLVTALLVMPGLVGRALASRFHVALLWSLAAGVLATVAGLVLVTFTHLSSGPPVVFVLTALLLLASAVRTVLNHVRRGRATGSPARVEGRSL
jgi:ABC-type Mn2+/Zn2+ transport system permease subunit